MYLYFLLSCFCFLSIHCAQVIDGFTQLHHIAFKHPQDEVEKLSLLNEAQQLLLLGHEVDCLDDSGRTPLQIAVEQENFLIVQLLVRHGADFNCSSGTTTPFLSSALCTNSAIPELFLNMSHDIDSRDNQLNTVLHIALKPENFPPSKKMENPFPNIQLFLKHGADPNARNRLQQTPLHLCAHFQDCTQIAALLVMHGADINVQQHAGIAPLHTCSRLGFWQLVKYFIREGADPDIASRRRKETPLHHAVMAFHRINKNDIKKVINLLSNAQAEMNSVTRENKTALDILCYDMEVIKPDKELIEHLRSKGAKRAHELISSIS